MFPNVNTHHCKIAMKCGSKIKIFNNFIEELASHLNLYENPIRP